MTTIETTGTEQQRAITETGGRILQTRAILRATRTKLETLNNLVDLGQYRGTTSFQRGRQALLEETIADLEAQLAGLQDKRVRLAAGRSD